MSKNPRTDLFQTSYEFGKELIVDGFAGGGGASTGIEMALGVSPDVAINHDIEAIALHAANHPRTRHYISDIFEIDPLLATMGRPVGLFWLSPDCKHHSKAKGGKPKDKKIRSLAWVAVKWAKKVKPRVIMLENVEEFKDWCPLDNCGYPVKEKRGETFKLFVSELEKLGYKVEWKELRACDYGAPTIRKRLFLIARCDGRPIIFPEPTHADPQSEEVKSGKLLPYKTAAEIIDWNLPTYSIFMSKEDGKKYGVRRPLSEKTMERIMKGFKKFVMDSPEPFVVKNMNSNVPRPVSTPLSTILTGNHHYLTVPFISTYYGKTKYSSTRGQEVNKPLATITAGGSRHGIVTPFVSQLNKQSIGFDLKKPIGAITSVNKQSLITPFMMAIDHGSSKNSTWSIEDPISTITAKARHALVVPYLCKHYTGVVGQDVRKPLGTITTADHHSLQTAFIHKYYGVEERQRISDPLHTITTKDRFGLVEIKGVKYQVHDIGFRMFTPRELYNAQGFPKGYKINITMPNGKTLSKTAQVRMCGNSVSPVIPEALVKANFQVEVIEGVA